MSGVPRKPTYARSALILTIALLIASPVSAAITGATIISGGTGASFIKLTVPFDTSSPSNTIGDDTFQTNNLYGFDEDQNIVLGAPLAMDMMAARSTTSVLAAGMKVKSHSIFFDPVSGSIDATVDFDSDIIGLILSTPQLVATDSMAHTSVTYLSPPLRGLEIDDSVTISGPRQIRFTTNASTPGDYVRVLTADADVIHMPEPSTATTVSLVLALAALRYGWLRSSRS